MASCSWTTSNDTGWYYTTPLTTSGEVLITDSRLRFAFNIECCLMHTVMHQLLVVNGQVGMLFRRSPKYIFPRSFTFWSYFWSMLNIDNDKIILAFGGLHESTISVLFPKKIFHIIVSNFYTMKLETSLQESFRHHLSGSSLRFW